MFAITLGLGASLFWGTADFFGGVQSRRLPALAVALWSQLAGGLLVLAAVLAQGAAPSLRTLGLGAIGGAFGGTALLAFYRALAEGAMSVVAPISACAGLLPVVAAFVGGTAPTGLEMAGIAAALAGIVLVSRTTTADQHPSGRPGVVVALALYAALGIGLYFVLVHAAAEGPAGSPLWAVTAGRAGSLPVLLAIAAASRPRPPWPGLRLPLLVLVGVLDTSANLLFAAASTRGNLGVVGVLSSLYPVVTVVLARLILAERLSWSQNVGVVVALLGVGLLATG
ncbi:MAG TPA: DMT family transporter [Actinomycetes bacterium]|jgi:drug/metabolite transporter (DMT)-like permease|nr:DMT family transporter [Actinomycetes bacterium]